jgi:hypothetical protein
MDAEVLDLLAMRGPTWSAPTRFAHHVFTFDHFSGEAQLLMSRELAGSTHVTQGNIQAMKRFWQSRRCLPLRWARAQATEIVIYTARAHGRRLHLPQRDGQAVRSRLRELARPFGYDVRRVPPVARWPMQNACANETQNICFGIGQGGLTYEAVESGGTRIIRNDLPGECAMAFTNEPRLPNWRSVMETPAV